MMQFFKKRQSMVERVFQRKYLGLNVSKIKHLAENYYDFYMKCFTEPFREKLIEN